MLRPISFGMQTKIFCRRLQGLGIGILCHL